MMAIEVACDFFASMPVCSKSGTTIIPPPAPNRPFNSPAANPIGAYSFICFMATRLSKMMK